MHGLNYTVFILTRNPDFRVPVHSMCKIDLVTGWVPSKLEHQCWQNWLTLTTNQVDSHLLFSVFIEQNES